MTHRINFSRFVVCLAAGIVATLAPGLKGWQPAYADATPISSQPIFIAPSTTDVVKPNIMMVLDDSGSMGWAHMPDPVENWARASQSGNARYGFVSPHCNGVFYNPSIVYTPPVDANGNSYPNSVFSAAPIDGFNASSSTVDLSSSFRGWTSSDFNLTGLSRDSDPAGAAYYYTYDAKNPVTNPSGKGTITSEAQKKYHDTTSVFYRECGSDIGSTTAIDGVTPVNQLFKKVTVSSTSGIGGTDERTNFANWYSYYRNRMMMMKSATSLAFKVIDDGFRVGYIQLNKNDAASFLNISDFDGTQKSAFYNRLFAATPSGGTPLRSALANVGRIYAGKMTSTPDGATVTDPVQYSCQQNFTILSTDGYWNGDTTTGAIKRADGTAVGNEDGALSRPFFDGASTTTTIKTPYTSTKSQQKTTTTTNTETWRRTTTALGAACTLNTVGSRQSTPFSVGSLSGSTRYGGVGKASSSPSSSRCTSLGGSGADQGWFCYTDASGNYPAGFTAAASVTTSAGKTWYLTSNTSQTECKTARSINNSLRSDRGVCAETAGTNVVSTTQTQPESTVVTVDSLDSYEATNQYTLQTITNGVPGPVSPLQPSSPVYNLTANLNSSTSTTVTCAGLTGSCPAAAAPWTNGSSTTVCTANSSLPTPGSTTPTMVSSTPGTPNTTMGTIVAASGPTAGSAITTTSTTGGTSSTVADVAAHYYYTNLRTTTLGNCSPTQAKNDLCLGGVPGTQEDPATWQHMTTFSVGLGARGQMVYSRTYPQDAKSKIPGDYTDIFYGNAANATTCTWRDALTTAGAACNWPVPGADKIENIDDLWHAAVNGHGQYFSATNPADLAGGLAGALGSIRDKPKPGTAASAATTNPKVSETDRYQFSSFFLSVEWSGDLIRQTKDLVTGQPPVFDLLKRDPVTFDWSARDQLGATAYTARKIYTKGSAGLIPFTWADIKTEGLQNYFTVPHISTAPPGNPTVLTGLTQFCVTGLECLSSTAQSKTEISQGGAAGEALVNFLRGDRSQEGDLYDMTKFFRKRAHVLGDIVSSQPQYSGPPKWNYSDSGYAAYKSAQAARQPIVFAAANDGMLHAFNAGTGAEMWAYIPSFVLPRLYTLADKNYWEKHQYFVEGTPQVGDVCLKAPDPCTAADWRTIVVGGLNGGGTGYYALDITDPATPKLLWEFSHENMGYSFGNPEITKMDDGNWVVLMTSGYNNCPKMASGAQKECVKNGTGDGRGYLYVVKASDGTLMQAIGTGEGSVTLPSGLGKIVAHVDASFVSRRVYGGDLYGNLWRFTIGSGGYSAQRLATFKDDSGNNQPVMSKPQVTTVNSLPVVYVGTGRYLSTADVGVSPKNSFYAIKDSLESKDYGNPRANTTDFIRLTAVNGLCASGTDSSICSAGDPVRTVTQTVGNAGDSVVNKSGWILDFPDKAGEIQFTDPKLVLGTMTFTTSIPTVQTSNDVCRISTNPSEGISFLYMVDYLNGGVVGGQNSTQGVVGSSLGQGIATSPQYSQLQDGSVIITTRMSGGNDVFTKGRFNTQNAAAKRISWRELIN